MSLRANRSIETQNESRGAQIAIATAETITPTPIFQSDTPNTEIVRSRAEINAASSATRTAAVATHARHPSVSCSRSSASPSPAFNRAQRITTPQIIKMISIPFSLLSRRRSSKPANRPYASNMCIRLPMIDARRTSARRSITSQVDASIGRDARQSGGPRPTGWHAAAAPDRLARCQVTGSRSLHKLLEGRRHPAGVPRRPFVRRGRLATPDLRPAATAPTVARWDPYCSHSARNLTLIKDGSSRRA